MPKEKLTKILNEPKTSLFEERIKDIRKNLINQGIFKPKNKKKIRKNLLRNRKQKRIFVMIAMRNIGYFCKLWTSKKC